MCALVEAMVTEYSHNPCHQSTYLDEVGEDECDLLLVAVQVPVHFVVRSKRVSHTPAQKAYRHTTAPARRKEKTDRCTWE